MITQTWFQAETGRIPISGAGYGGAFAGPGFDAVWLDMSEIVRPTRDGIHGRETISTAVILGGRLPALQFDAQGRLVSTLPPQIEIPIPVLFDPLLMPLPGDGAQVAMVRAAARLGTLALVRDGRADRGAGRYGEAIAPVLDPGDDLEDPSVQAAIRASRLVEIELEPEPGEGLAAVLPVQIRCERSIRRP